jgi:YegS/Rv2252/BmrU family lipid kinase
LKRHGLAYDIRETERPGDATRLAREAREEGIDLLAVTGGDGTMNEVVQAYVDDDGGPLPGPELALVPAGTGGDLRRTFHLGTDAAEAVSRIVHAPTRPIDLGVLRLTSDDGSPLLRAFVNIASFGVGGKIDRIVNDSPKWMGGRAAFLLGTARAMASYRNAPVTVDVDGQPWHEGRIVNVALANGQYFGGGMHVAPEADPADGLLDVVCIGDLSLLESATSTKALYEGTHLRLPKVRHTRGREITARPARAGDEVLIDLDGEAPGRLPLTARVLPGALRLRV